MFFEKTLAFLAILLSFVPAQGRVPVVPPWDCTKAFERLEASASLAEISAIKDRYTKTDMSSVQGNEDLEARRLINNKDWQRAKEVLGENARLIYSQKTLESWKKAEEFVRQNLNEEISPELLKKIHTVAMKGMPFHGYEGRRLKLRYERGEISQEDFRDLLNKAFNEDANPSGTNHSTLPGKFRWDPIDDILHAGSSFNSETKQRFFDWRELQAARRNPHIRVDESTVKRIGPDQYVAKSFYTRPDQVNSEVEKIFTRLRSDLRQVKNDDQVILAVARMQKDLTIVHPFLDGNGRTVRLLRDLILQKHGLPPPVLLREKEIELSVEEIAKDIKAGMRIYVDTKSHLSSPREPR